MADPKKEEEKANQMVVMAAAQLAMILKTEVDSTPNDRELGTKVRSLVREFFE